MADFGFGSCVEVHNNRQVLIDGCTSILDFDENSIAVICGKLKINVQGENLKIKLLTEKTAVLEGIISYVKFDYL